MISASNHFYLVLGYIYLKSNIYSKIKNMSVQHEWTISSNLCQNGRVSNRDRFHAQLRNNHLIIYFMINHAV